MSIWKFRVGRRIGSASLVADAWNDSVDIVSAGAALAAVGLTLLDPTRFLAADHYRRLHGRRLCNLHGLACLA